MNYKVVLRNSLIGIISLGLMVLISLYSYKGYKLYNAPIEVVADASHELNVHGVITDLSLEIAKLKELVNSGVKEIFIDINSEGGAVVVGDALVMLMQSAQYHGVVFTCVVTGIAISMAVAILGQCDNRYALFGTTIMWHSAGLMTKTSVLYNNKKLARALDDIKVLNEGLWDNTRMYFYPWYFTEHFVNETLLDSTEVESNGFGFLSVIFNYGYKEGQIKLPLRKKKISPALLKQFFDGFTR